MKFVTSISHLQFASLCNFYSTMKVILKGIKFWYDIIKHTSESLCCYYIDWNGDVIDTAFTARSCVWFIVFSMVNFAFIPLSVQLVFIFKMNKIHIERKSQLKKTTYVGVDCHQSLFFLHSKHQIFNFFLWFSKRFVLKIKLTLYLWNPSSVFVQLVCVILLYNWKKISMGWLFSWSHAFFINFCVGYIRSNLLGVQHDSLVLLK